MSTGTSSLGAAMRSLTRVCGGPESGPSRLRRAALPELIISDAYPSEGSSHSLAQVQEWRDPHGAVVACCSLHDGQYRIDLPRLASFYFDRGGDVVRAVPSAPVRSAVIVDAYHHSILPVMVQALGTEVLHASAVLTRRGVVAFCAISGTGKSTLAFGLGRRGYPVWADDAVAVEVAAQPRCLPLPFEIRLRPAALALFGRGRTVAPITGWASADAPPDQRPALASLVVLNRVTGAGEPPAVERLRPSAALSRVLAHAYCFSLDDGKRKRQMIRHYLDLTAQVPIFEIRFEARLDRLPALLDAVERMVAGEMAG